MTRKQKLLAGSPQDSSQNGNSTSPGWFKRTLHSAAENFFRRIDKSESDAKLERLETLMEAQAKAIERISNCVGLDDLYRVLCEEITKMGFDEARIFRLETNENGGMLAGKMRIGRAGELDCEYLSHSVDEGDGHISTKCILEKKTIHLKVDQINREVALSAVTPKSGSAIERSELAVSPDEAESMIANARQHWVFEKIAIPLLDGDNVIGAIVADNRESHRLIQDHTISSFKLIVALASYSIKMNGLAIVDALTGLYTRRYVDSRMAEEFKKATRRIQDARIAERPLEPTQFSIAMFDIDDFKKINDKLGHAAGDDVLKKLAEIATDRTRDEDTFARYGGEEFLLFMPGAGRKQASQRAEELRRLMEQAIVFHDGKEIKFTVSYGVAEYNPQRDKDLESAKRRADDALNAAKNRGKNKGFEDVGDDRQVLSEIKATEAGSSP